MEETKEGCSECGQAQIINENTNVILQQNVPCTSCGGGKSITGKLGTCQQCIALNIIGSLFGWLVYVALYFLYPKKNILMATMVIATFFTALLSAHGIAYLIKKNNRK